MTPQEEGLMALIAERIGSLDRRIEGVGRDLQERLDHSDARHERHAVEIAARKDDEHEELWKGLTDVQRSVQMVKGAIGLLILFVVPFATIYFDHLLR